MPAIESGTKAPDISLQTVFGEDFRLGTALACGPVVIAFFKISCPVCQYAMPFVQRLHERFRGTDATIIGISQNDAADTEQFMREYGLRFPVLLDDPEGYPVSNAYGLTNVPTLFLVGADGRIEITSIGWSRADVEEMARRLSQFVGQPAATIFKPGEDVADLRAG